MSVNLWMNGALPQKTEILPVASEKKRRFDCTAVQAVTATLSGECNRQYRHGERTKAAIAEQQKFSALLKILRLLA